MLPEVDLRIFPADSAFHGGESIRAPHRTIRKGVPHRFSRIPHSTYRMCPGCPGILGFRERSTYSPASPHPLNRERTVRFSTPLRAWMCAGARVPQVRPCSVQKPGLVRGGISREFTVQVWGKICAKSCRVSVYSGLSVPASQGPQTHPNSVSDPVKRRIPCHHNVHRGGRILHTGNKQSRLPRQAEGIGGVACTILKVETDLTLRGIRPVKLHPAPAKVAHKGCPVPLDVACRTIRPPPREVIFYLYPNAIRESCTGEQHRGHTVPIHKERLTHTGEYTRDKGFPAPAIQHIHLMEAVRRLYREGKIQWPHVWQDPVSPHHHPERMPHCSLRNAQLDALSQRKQAILRADMQDPEGLPGRQHHQWGRTILQDALRGLKKHLKTRHRVRAPDPHPIKGLRPA